MVITLALLVGTFFGFIVGFFMGAYGAAVNYQKRKR